MQERVGEGVLGRAGMRLLSPTVMKMEVFGVAGLAVPYLPCCIMGTNDISSL